MSRVSAAKHQIYLSKWASIINECQSSGLTVVDWCDDNNINIKSYYYWLKKVREATLDNLPKAVVNNLPEPNQDNPITFKKLEVESPLPGFQPAVVIHLNGATVEVTNGTNRETVEAVLFALKAIC